MLRKSVHRPARARSHPKPAPRKKKAAKVARFTFRSETKAKERNGALGHGRPQPSRPAKATSTQSTLPPAPAATPVHTSAGAASDAHSATIDPLTAESPLIAGKVKELLRLSQDQGYLTYDDINDALPDDIVTPELLDDIYSKLRGFEVKIVESPEVDRPKEVEQEEEDTSRLDILDDPVQMYLRQMGKVPLLTREQEIEICKRIEEGDTEARKILFGFGFSGKEHIAIAEKLLS